MAKVFDNPDALLTAVGEPLGATDWIDVTQDRIDTFADATGDHQWIHVDPAKAKDGPFGTTIAHGYLTLSLTSLFLLDLLTVNNVSMGINYGTNKVRFPAPVREGSRIRGVGEVIAADEVKGGVQVVVKITVEVDGQERPACVVEAIARFLR